MPDFSHEHLPIRVVFGTGAARTALATASRLSTWRVLVVMADSDAFFHVKDSLIVDVAEHPWAPHRTVARSIPQGPASTSTLLWRPTP
jgi:hypothetical protein